MNVPALSVIVAAFNEAETIAACVTRIAAALPESCEILVVDGGSDKTGDVVRSLGKDIPDLHYIRNQNDLGKGHAIRVGIEAARGEIMAQIDADLQFLPEELSRLVRPIRDGIADVTLGSRFIEGSVRLPGSTPLLRALGNRITSAYASLLCWHRMTDVLAGIKAWSREAAHQIDLHSNNYSYEVEIPVKAIRRGLRVVDVPITTAARQGGETSVNVVSDGAAILWDITRFRMGLK
jgi:glycosyltransferase involved in cell wall biosynthesis